jgi:urease accessory protein
MRNKARLRRSSIKAGPGRESNGAGARSPDAPLQEADLWLLLQLADSAFPTGGFVHSNGLEAAAQQGEVRGRAELLGFAEASLQQAGHASLPFAMAAFDTPGAVGEMDDHCEAFTSNHVANRGSRAQGRAFLAGAERIFEPEIGARMGSLEFAHFAPVFGACLRRLEVARETTARIYLFHHLRSILAAAVRLNLAGPMEAQTLLRKLSPRAEAIRQACDQLTPDQAAQTSPLLDLWQGAQDRLYSRLFQS